MGQLQIDNPEKLATQGTEDDKKKYMRRISPSAIPSCIKPFYWNNNTDDYISCNK
jgi:hypothetical protein